MDGHSLITGVVRMLEMKSINVEAREGGVKRMDMPPPQKNKLHPMRKAAQNKLHPMRGSNPRHWA